MDLKRLESEIKKRCAIPYNWGGKQTNEKDSKTNFIYKTYSFKKLKFTCLNLSPELKNYAFNRWFNFWSAMAVEELFSTHTNVTANKNKKDKLVDFKINDITFDHKTTVFPKGFENTIEYAKENPKELIQWLYDNQSQEGRKHLENRLFIVLYNSKTKQHWKLKAEIDLFNVAIENYLISFSEKKLFKFDFGNGTVYSEIIWLEA